MKKPVFTIFKYINQRDSLLLAEIMNTWNRLAQNNYLLLIDVQDLLFQVTIRKNPVFYT